MLDDGCDFLEYEDSIIIPEMYGYETIEWSTRTYSLSAQHLLLLFFVYDNK